MILLLTSFINSVDLILPRIQKLFSRIFDSGEFPESWGYAIIVTLFMNGNVNNPNNYRGISLLDTFGKIYTSILTRRLPFYTNIIM